MATKRQQLAIDYLVTKYDLPLHTAQGIVGGLSGESGTNLDSKARNKGDGKDGSDSVGMAQWNGMRAVNGAKFLGKPILEANGYEQLDFLMHELKGVESKAFGHINSADNAADVTRAFVKYFERPADPKAGDIRAKNYTSVLTGVKPTEGYVAPERKPVTPEQQDAANAYAKAEQDKISARITEQTNEAVKESKGENDVPWYDIYGQVTKFGRQIATRGLGTVAGEIGLGIADGVQNAASNVVQVAGDVGGNMFNGGEPSTKPLDVWLQQQAQDTLDNNKRNEERNATSMGYTGGKFIGETAPLLAVPMASAPATAGMATRAAYMAGNAVMQGAAAYATSGEDNRASAGYTAAGITAGIPVLGRALGGITKRLPDVYPTAARAERQVGAGLYANLGNGAAGTKLDDAAKLVANDNLAKFRANVDNTSLIKGVNPTTQEVMGNKFYNDSVKLNANPTLINANEANYAARQAFVDSPTASLRDTPPTELGQDYINFKPYRVELNPINATSTSDYTANTLRNAVKGNVEKEVAQLKETASNQYRIAQSVNNASMNNPLPKALETYRKSTTLPNGSTRIAMVQKDLDNILAGYGNDARIPLEQNHQLRGDLRAYLKTLETSKEPNIASKQKVVNDILDDTKYVDEGYVDANNYYQHSPNDSINTLYAQGDKTYARAKELEDLALYKTVTKPQSAEQSVGNIASTAKGRGELNQYLDTINPNGEYASLNNTVDVINPMRNSVWDAVTKTKGDAPLVFDDKLQQKVVEANVDNLATKLSMTKELEALSKEIKFTRNSKGTMVLGSNTTEKLMNVISGTGFNLTSVGAIATAIHTGGASIAIPVGIALYKATARKAFLNAFNKAGVEPKLAEQAIDKFLAREATKSAIDKAVSKAIKVGTKSSSVIAQDTN